MRVIIVCGLAFALAACNTGALSVAVMDPPTIPIDCMDALMKGRECAVQVTAGESAGGISGSPLVSLGHNRAIGPARLRTDLFN